MKTHPIGRVRRLLQKKFGAYYVAHVAKICKVRATKVDEVLLGLDRDRTVEWTVAQLLEVPPSCIAWPEPGSYGEEVARRNR